MSDWARIQFGLIDQKAPQQRGQRIPACTVRIEALAPQACRQNLCGIKHKSVASEQEHRQCSGYDHARDHSAAARHCFFHKKKTRNSAG